MRPPHLIAVASLIAGCVSLPAIGAGAVDASALTALAVPVAVATPTPPSVIGGKTKTGVEMRGSANKSNRLKRNGQTQKKAPVKGANAEGPAGDKSKRPNSPEQRKPFRLNVGICGMPEADGNRVGPGRCQVAEQPAMNRRTIAPPSVVQPRPQDVVWEDVRTEVKDVLFPKLVVRVQPRGRTLVNLDTIVYTEDRGVTTATVELLGFPVMVEATPMSYVWRFGDGASLVTTSPGKPYPAKEITHKYMKRASVGLTVTTNYAARFNVAGTGWQYVDGLVGVTGPVTPLTVREAVPVLVEPGR